MVLTLKTGTLGPVKAGILQWETQAIRVIGAGGETYTAHWISLLASSVQMIDEVFFALLAISGKEHLDIMVAKLSPLIMTAIKRGHSNWLETQQVVLR